MTGNNGGELNIAQNIKVIEWLKSELLSEVTNLFKGIFSASEEKIISALSTLIIICYVLGKRLGFSFARIDGQVESSLRHSISNNHELEKWYGDLSALIDYLEARKR